MIERGSARVYTISRRVPLTTMLCFQKDGVVILDAQGVIVQVNSTYETLCGRGRDELLGIPVTGSGLPIIDDPELTSLIGQNHGPKDFSKKFYDQKLDITRFFKVRMIPSVFEGGQSGLTMIAEDITERTEFEKRLEESESRYRAVVEDLTDLVCRRLPDGTITFANVAFCRYFGKLPEELIGKKFRPRIPLPDLDTHADPFGAVIVPNALTSHEQRVLSDIGDVRWIQWHNRTLCDSSGAVHEIQSVGRDITGQREREKEILMNNCAIAASPYAIALWNSPGSVIYTNNAFRSLFGYDDELEILGKPLEQFVLRTLDNSVYHVASSLLNEGRWSGTVLASRKDGSVFEATLSGLLLKDERYFPQNGGIGTFTVGDKVQKTPEPGRAQKTQAVAEERPEPPGPSPKFEITEYFDPIPMPTFSLDTAGKVIVWNRAMEVITGVRREEVRGTGTYREVLKGIYPELQPLLIDIIDTPEHELRARYPGVEQYGNEYYLERYVPSFRNNRGAYINEKAARIIAPSGSVIACLESIQDVTDVKNARESLMRMKEEIDSSLNEKIRQILNYNGINDI
ncbi:PAS domain S-box-containing protein [Methanolinea mesophila]|uniref:PAS domain-containing protein n=1 Tax=Methanolinea mesophila TaxID=547055 RepID=UPI001AE12ECB|nr:PAS domain-containing protein [Methanolinea mesophila]MBP1928925.1 PAS domain S-box-containing protein [Methanolinea mesophila]